MLRIGLGLACGVVEAISPRASFLLHLFLELLLALGTLWLLLLSLVAEGNIRNFGTLLEIDGLGHIE